ncbi:MAG: hypothetical protein ACOC9T_03870 [Myxococcota bacterium]
MGKWWCATAIALGLIGCAASETITQVAGVGMSEDGSAVFVKRYRIPGGIDRVVLVKCSGDDDPECDEHVIDGPVERQGIRKLPMCREVQQAPEGTTGGSAIPM